MYTMVHIEISEQRKEREERDVGVYCKGPLEKFYYCLQCFIVPMHMEYSEHSPSPPPSPPKVQCTRIEIKFNKRNS